MSSKSQKPRRHRVGLKKTLDEITAEYFPILAKGIELDSRPWGNHKESHIQKQVKHFKTEDKKQSWNQLWRNNYPIVGEQFKWQRISHQRTQRPEKVVQHFSSAKMSKQNKQTNKTIKPQSYIQGKYPSGVKRK